MITSVIYLYFESLTCFLKETLKKAEHIIKFLFISQLKNTDYSSFEYFGEIKLIV